VLSPLRTGRRWLAALSLGALAAAAPAAATGWHPDLQAGIAYAGARDGAVRLSVRADGGAWGWGADQASRVLALVGPEAVRSVARRAEMRRFNRARTPDRGGVTGRVVGRWGQRPSA
jgi:hypothetical protein